MYWDSMRKATEPLQSVRLGSGMIRFIYIFNDYLGSSGEWLGWGEEGDCIKGNQVRGCFGSLMKTC